MSKNQPKKTHNENKTKQSGGEEKETGNKLLQTGAGDIVNDFIEDVWKVMTPAMTQRLRQVLTEDLGLSKTDANKFIECQRDIRRQRICLKKTKREVKIGPRNQWIKELSKDIADQIAKLIVGILLSDRNDRTKKLTEKVLDRLCDVTGENTTIEDAKTRVERILVIVADRLANWINENVTDIELSASVETISDLTMTGEESICSLTSYDYSSEVASGLSEDQARFRDSLISFGSDIVSEKREAEQSGDEESEIESGEGESSEGSDLEEESEVESENSASEQSTVQESEEESTEVEEEGEEESVHTEEEESGEAETEDRETEGEEEEKIEEESIPEETVAVGKEEEEITKHTSIVLEQDQDEREPKIIPVSPMDIFDLLEEDFLKIPETEKKTDRQKAMKEVIDKRLKMIAEGKDSGSLDSIVKYDIDNAASIVANWVEKILSSTEDNKPLPLVTEPKQGSAFEIMQGDGSQLKVHKISSMTVAKQVAQMRGLEPPLRKKKVPRTMSPINIKSMNDWADWALGAANVGKEWDKWLGETLESVENQLVKERDSETREGRHRSWKEWQDEKAREAAKWRAEKQRIKAEGALWKRKLESEQTKKPEQETRAITY